VHRAAYDGGVPFRRFAAAPVERTLNCARISSFVATVSMHTFFLPRV
jgi:hypothetical protein